MKALYSQNINRFSELLPISLILNGYASGIPGVSLGSVCFIIFAIQALKLNQWKLNSVSISAIIAVFAFLLISLFDYIAYYQPAFGNFLIPFSKIIIWCVFIVCVAPTYFNLFCIEKWFTRIGLILTTYLIMQNIAYYGMGVYLPNIFRIGILQPYADGYADYEGLSGGIMIRPASLLSESSYLGNYLMLNLSLTLQRIKYRKAKHDLLLCLFITLGIVLSSSTSAILLSVIIWFVLGWNILKRYKLLFMSSAIAIGVVLLAVPLSLEMFDGKSQIDTAVFQTFDKLNHMDNNTRFGKSFELLEELSPLQSFFGVGIGNEQTFIKPFIYGDFQYLNSYTAFIIGVGYFGAIFLVIFFFEIFYSCLKNRNRLACTLLLIYIIKIFGSGFLFNTYGVLYMFVIAGSIYNPIHKIKN